MPVSEDDMIDGSNIVLSSPLHPSSLTKKKKEAPLITIDVISIGSRTRLDYLQAQNETWASHPYVRNFFPITEDDDWDPLCPEYLEKGEKIDAITKWCRRKYASGRKGGKKKNASWLENRWIHAYGVGKWVRSKANPAGWMCAQRRFVVGMAKVFANYEYSSSVVAADDDGDQGKDLRSKEEISANTSIPDYLIIVDDDTYISIDRLYDQELSTINPSDTPWVAAGCRTGIPNRDICYFGGNGLLWSRRTIHRLQLPLWCYNGNHSDTTIIFDDDDDALFIADACKKIKLNLLGELKVYKNGMTLWELMTERARMDPFSSFPNWTKGFCFHSDHYFSIFMNQFNLSASDLPIHAIQGSYFDHKKEPRGDCAKSCHVTHAITCHYQTAANMRNLSKIM